MYQVIAATQNPSKIQSILTAFEQIFGTGSCHIHGVNVDSGVSEQPFGDEETRAGARQRVANARQAEPKADFWVALEAGIDQGFTYSWAAIENAQRLRGEARSATLPLPKAVLAEVEAGRPLGEVMSTLTGIEAIGRKEGAIGIFTARALTRSNVNAQAVIMALSPFHNAIYR